MTSSRWIACCHRRLVQHTPPTLHPNSMGQSEIGHSTSFVRPLAALNPNHHAQANNQHRGNHLSTSHHANYQLDSPLSIHTLSSQHYASTHLKSPAYPNGAISSSYQTPPRHHQRHGLPSSMSSTNSPMTPSNSSPMSSSSLYELGRKSSSSSTSSTNSFTLTNDRFSNISMKHSRSTVDLCSLQAAQNGHHLRHHQHYRPKDDSALTILCPPMPSIENTITIISPLDGLLINCQTNADSLCAQISPSLNVIAVSNEYWVAFYSIKSNECLGTLQFPSRCLYWTWIKADTVAVVTDKDVFHWSLSGIDTDSNYIQTGDFLRLIFKMDNDIRENQITNYAIDPLFGNWCALSTLFVDDDGKCPWNTK